MQKTTNYEIFKRRPDNRHHISQQHVRFLAELISVDNKLIDYPILVNRDMEVVNGNHRLEAAKKLGVEIYYVIGENLTPKDIIISNSAKGWQISDYFNYYLVNEYEEYVNLDKFIKKYDLTLHIGYNICVNKYVISNGVNHSVLFKMGKYIHPIDIEDGIMTLFCKTISIINLNSSDRWCQNSKFWSSLTRLFEYTQFDERRWFRNLEKLRTRCGPRAKEVEYLDMILDIYNYGSHNKLIAEMLTKSHVSLSKDHSIRFRKPTLRNIA